MVPAAYVSSGAWTRSFWPAPVAHTPPSVQDQTDLQTWLEPPAVCATHPASFGHALTPASSLSTRPSQSLSRRSQISGKPVAVNGSPSSQSSELLATGMPASATQISVGAPCPSSSSSGCLPVTPLPLAWHITPPSGAQTFWPGHPYGALQPAPFPRFSSTPLTQLSSRPSQISGAPGCTKPASSWQSPGLSAYPAGAVHR